MTTEYVDKKATSGIHITETGGSASAWYRKWSDGWLEQGGYVTTEANNNIQLITLPKAFKDANYTALATPCGTDIDNEFGIYVKGDYKVTTTSFYVLNDLVKGERIMWKAQGWA